MPTEVKISSCQQFVKFLFIICRVDIRHKIWQKQHNFALLLKTDTENIHIPPKGRLEIPGGGGGEHLREMHEMYKVKLVSQSVSQSLSQLGQSVNRVSMHLIHVTIMVNEKEL